jgi:predicted AAA+ superfamily ATPase
VSDAPAADRARLRTALDACAGLALFGGVLANAACCAVLALCEALAAAEPEPRAVAAYYAAAFRALATAMLDDPPTGLADAWQAHLINCLLDDTNPWSAQVERANGEGIAPTLRAQAARDLRALRLLFALDAETLLRLARTAVAEALPALAEAWEPWLRLAPLDAEDERFAPRGAFARLAADADDWATLLDPLEDHWRRHGTGIVARHHMLRWAGRERGLVGVAHPDPIRLSQLIAYEREHSVLAANLERFLAGLPAHDALLYGPPGTGKSSTVKALANAYAAAGLRLIELRRDQLGDLDLVAAAVRDRAPRFLLFIDDLSFEEHETAYKGLKTLLEGAAEARPTNLLVYATTNRFNLVRERFSERAAAVDDVHWSDTLDEKLALAERFGLRVTFAPPEQERFLRIVAGLAADRDLVLPEEELRARALAWERARGRRSGRLARQFVDELQAELARTTPEAK